MTDLLSEFRNYLVAQGIVRRPDVAGAQPPLWLDPKLGTPAPGEGQGTGVSDLVLAAYPTGGFPPVAYGSWVRKPIVDLRFRGLSSPTIQAAELAITKVIADRRDWMMGAQYVVESEQWRALQRLGSDEQGFEYVSAYWFELLRA